MTEHKYKKSPIIEALCEVRFPSDNNWRINSFIKFANKAETLGFIDVVDAAEGFQIQFKFNEGMGDSNGTPPLLKPVSRRIQTWNKNKSLLWQASAELFAANNRAPYLGWTKFKPHILKGLDVYSRIAQPKKAHTLALHYINRIEFGTDESALDYVRFCPPDIKYADSITNFLYHTQQTFNDGDMINISCTKDMESDKDRAVILNLLYVTNSPLLERVKIKQKLETAHNRILTAFENTITEKQRLRMEEL